MRLRGGRWVAGFAALSIGIGFAVSVNASLAVGSGSPPTACQPGGPIEQKSPPIDCPMITVKPNTNLVDLQTVTVYGRDFQPGSAAATIECAGNATGENQCDLNTLFEVPISSSGTFTLSRFVRRIITTGDGTTVDCGSAPGTCIMGAANINNVMEATSQPLSFNPSVPPVLPTVFAVPQVGLADHQLIKVSGVGMFPSRGIEIEQCLNGTPSYLTCDYSTQAFVLTGPRGGFGLTWAVHRILYINGLAVDCASRPGACVVFAGDYPGDTSDEALAPLAFNSKIPPVAQTLAVVPSLGLRDHQLAQVGGTGFTPGGDIEVVQCQAGATINGLGCDYSTTQYVTGGLTGQFLITFAMHRMLGVGLPTPVDCAKVNACTVEAINVERPEEGATRAVAFNPTIPTVKASLKAVPSTGLTDDARVLVTGAGFTPYSSVTVDQCSIEALAAHDFGYCAGSGPYGGGGITEQVTGNGTFSVTFFVHISISDQSGVVNCAAKPGACDIVATRFTLTGDTASVAISFK
jgi:hypothetical protein